MMLAHRLGVRTLGLVNNVDNSNNEQATVFGDSRHYLLFQESY